MACTKKTKPAGITLLAWIEEFEAYASTGPLPSNQEEERQCGIGLV